MPWVFAFGCGDDSYYISNGIRHRWSNLPDTLEDLLRDDYNYSADKVSSMTLFSNGGYFVRAQDRVRYEDLPDELDIFLEETRVSMRDVRRVDHDASNPMRWGLQTDEQYYHQSMPDGLKNACLRGSAGKPTFHVGHGDSWICTWDDAEGNQQWDTGGLSRDVTRLVRESDRIDIAWLSPHSNDVIFLLLESGQAEYWAEASWNATIRSVM